MHCILILPLLIICLWSEEKYIDTEQIFITNNKRPSNKKQKNNSTTHKNNTLSGKHGIDLCMWIHLWHSLLGMKMAKYLIVFYTALCLCTGKELFILETKSAVRTCGWSFSGNLAMFTTDMAMGQPCEISIFDIRDKSQMCKYTRVIFSSRGFLLLSFYVLIIWKWSFLGCMQI